MNDPYRPRGVRSYMTDPVQLGMPRIRQEGEENALAWQADALCAQVDPEVFFPEKGGSTRDAKKICTSCDVRETCLEYALANDERTGIWGGLSERERRKLVPRTGPRNAERDRKICAMAAENVETEVIARQIGVEKHTVLRVVRNARKAAA